MGAAIKRRLQPAVAAAADAAAGSTDNSPREPHPDGSADARRILAAIRQLERDIATWSRKIDELDGEQNPKLELRFRHERTEMVRRLGLLRHRPRVPDDDQPVVSLSAYHRARGKTSATMALLRRVDAARECLCGDCPRFYPNDFDLSLCAHCGHRIEAHTVPGEEDMPLPRTGKTFPARAPTTRKVKRLMTQAPNPDPSHFAATDLDRAAVDAPARPFPGVDGPGFFDNPAAPAAEEEPQEDDDDSDLELPDTVTQEDIEEELTDNGFSAEAGRAQLTYLDESHYDGEWAVFEEGGKIERHGYGSMHYATGEVHSGDWERDVRHGRGKLIHSDGSVFRGAWEYGEIRGAGSGAMPSEDGSGKYVGDWYNGQRQGKGTMVSSEGDSYTGEWYQDLMHGKGEFTACNGDQYEGTFIRGEMEGIGTMRWAESGDKYTGHWSGGVMHGDGNFTSGVDGSIYRGLFVHGEKVGHGVIELAGGTSYSGLFTGADTDQVFGIIKTAAGDSFEVRPRSFAYLKDERMVEKVYS